jgi:phage terminase small subunit
MATKKRPARRKAKPAKQPPRKPSKRRAGLNPKQERFVAEYLKDLNGKQAAIRAGYSEKTAESQASRLLSHAKVAAAVAAGQAKTAAKLEITKEMIVDELRKIAFADLRKAVAWGPTQHTTVDDGGQKIVSSGVTLIDSSELDADTAAAVAEVGNTREGVKIKLHDKKGALVDLAKMLGFMVEKHEHTGKDGAPLVPAEMTPDQRREEIKRLLAEQPQLAAMVAASKQEK